MIQIDIKKWLFLICIILISCSPGQKMLRQQRAQWQYTHWKQDFKDYVLCNCLIKGYGDKDIAAKILDQDKSFASPLNHILFESASTAILKPIILEMKRDSAASVTSVAEGAAGKHVFSTCMRFYKSRELNAVARKEAVKWRNIRNIDSLMLNDPTF